MLSNLQTLTSQITVQIAQINNTEDLITFRNDVFGKNGSLTALLKGVKDLTDEAKKTVWKAVNDAKAELSDIFDARLKAIQQENIAKQLAEEFEDVTFPTSTQSSHLHPLTRVLHDIEDVFTRMGFETYESNAVTTEFLNFDALNVPKNHPARDMQDTFWLEGDGNVLATQTSSMQNLLLKNHSLPLRAIVMGRVFRNEAIDATHENTFYQVEGMVVDKNITMGHLKYTLSTMLSGVFGREVSVRLRPGYFPFVEPGVEVDFSCPFCSGNGCRICKKTGWVEFMGAWLIHPQVLKAGWIDSEEYSGFAFGFGLNRLAMMKYGINDIRYFQNPNLAFLEQF